MKEWRLSFIVSLAKSGVIRRDSCDVTRATAVSMRANEIWGGAKDNSARVVLFYLFVK